MKETFNLLLLKLAALIEEQQLARLESEGMTVSVHRTNYITRIVQGRKFSKIDIGGSGRYMVDNATGEIFGIKAYGVIHFGKRFGTLGNIHSWDWSGDEAKPRLFRLAPREELGYISDKGFAQVDVDVPQPDPSKCPTEPLVLGETIPLEWGVDYEEQVDALRSTNQRLRETLLKIASEEHLGLELTRDLARAALAQPVYQACPQEASQETEA